jgi:hypothetical protein
MSEYQYYEFLALDRPLTAEQRAELRSISEGAMTDTRLLELAASWEGLTPAQARMADALRLFVVTWDPLEWLAPRPEAVATASAWPAEIAV